jgi:hypothetical protein
LLVAQCAVAQNELRQFFSFLGMKVRQVVLLQFRLNLSFTLLFHDSFVLRTLSRADEVKNCLKFKNCVIMPRYLNFLRHKNSKTLSGIETVAKSLPPQPGRRAEFLQGPKQGFVTSAES